MDKASCSRPLPPARTEAAMDLFYQSPTHEEGLARLHFLVENGRRLGLLLGRGGSGKSLLLRVLTGQLRRQAAQVAHLRVWDQDPLSLLWSLAAELGCNPSPAASPLELWHLVADRLIANRHQRRRSVILLDELELATVSVQTLILRLIHIDPHPDATLTAVLAVRSDALSRLDERLLELCDLRIDLEPWDLHDTADFLQAAAQVQQLPQFEHEAAVRLYQLTDGSPRRITQLVHLACLAAEDQQRESIDAETIEAVHEALSTQALER